MSTKPSEVFAIPELLESILLEIPAKDLLVGQRLNTNFRDAINSSIKIQHVLFCRSDPAASREAEPRFYPFLEDIIHMTCKSRTLGIQVFPSTNSDWTPEPGMEWFFMDLPDLGLDCPHLRFDIHPSIYGRLEGSMAVLEATEATGSWERMMVTDPAIPTVITDTVFRDPVTECQTPLSMGALVAKLRDELGRLEEGLAEYEYQTESEDSMEFYDHADSDDGLLSDSYEVPDSDQCLESDGHEQRQSEDGDGGAELVAEEDED